MLPPRRGRNGRRRVKARRGEIYWVNFNPRRGSEQGGVRPALVVQNDRGNEYSSTTVVAALSSVPLDKPYPFLVPLAAGEAGLPKAGFVNCSQLMTADESRLGALIGRLDEKRMKQVDAALAYEFGILLAD